MLPLSRRPEIIRLHQLEQSQRGHYINEFTSVLQEYLPNRLWPLLPLLADIYYTYTTICMCRRRLGEEYTYVAMYNPEHYQNEGVLVNSNTRLLMFVLEIVQRHMVKGLLHRLWGTLEGAMGRWKWAREVVSLGVEGALEDGRLLMLMLFMLQWSKYSNLVDTVLSNQYIYTYMNKNKASVDYRVEGYMLLAVFVAKLIRFVVNTYKIYNQKPRKPKPEPQLLSPHEDQNHQQQQLCRICYDNLRHKSVTCCGHVFCWACILRYLSTHPECPVCRTECHPREVIQLQNY